MYRKIYSHANSIRVMMMMMYGHRRSKSMDQHGYAMLQFIGSQRVIVSYMSCCPQQVWENRSAL